MGMSAAPAIADLDDRGLALEATCSCGHSRVIPQPFLLTIATPQTVLYPFVLERLASRFRCAKRDSKGTTTLDLVRVIGS